MNADDEASPMSMFLHGLPVNRVLNCIISSKHCFVLRTISRFRDRNTSNALRLYVSTHARTYLRCDVTYAEACRPLIANMKYYTGARSRETVDCNHIYPLIQ